ncbi:RNA polymerase Rpb1 domain 5 [Carpediemonas membranifera]|uniref:DNA-directed RNA polymerase subunit n=1 Tax=Carpediemonas membranifera TaxID=201153 RepID=A0A8J6B761_9EUKA|nr:RNA polymerase Rpb1 domain 5 [Carpediemonas membranifera]|eukprot:KAG9397068.1 RNA polymerase Rpb1 domain 5 [Carpediemonas membranifera]
MSGRRGEEATRCHSFPKKIDGIQFSTFSDAEIAKVSEVEVCNGSVRQQSSEIVPYGPLDLRLGLSEKQGVCQTCGKALLECEGHYGFVKFPLPVIHPGYLGTVINNLNMVCHQCSSVLLTGEQQKKFRHLLDTAPGATEVKKIRETMLADCKKCKKCPHCTGDSGLTQKVGAFKVVHDQARLYTNAGKTSLSNPVRIEYQQVAKVNLAIQQNLHRVMGPDLTPIDIRRIFSNITDEHVRFLCMDPKISRPEDHIVQTVAVPPSCIRPSVNSSFQGSNEDDITMKLADIVKAAHALESDIETGADSTQVMTKWEALQIHLAIMISGEVPKNVAIDANTNYQSIRGLETRLKGKQGRYRGNLLGKRVDFSGRTVIGPDPNLGIHEVGVPRLMAMRMTFPEPVNARNIQMLRSMVNNGPEVWPGANYIIKQGRGNRPSVKQIVLPFNREQLARKLEVGDVVERHMINGDACLFNRQPSLHRVSIMCHQAHILEGRTLRFNVACCGPYNADFDGDEMNLHLPQTLEAREEALHLMGLRNNMIVPRAGMLLVHATQDILSGAHILTLKDTFITRGQAMNLLTAAVNGDEQIIMPAPAVVFPRQLWTGKQLVSTLLKVKLYRTKRHAGKVGEVSRLSLEAKEKKYSGSGKWMCLQDGYVVVRDSDLLAGSLGKGVLGGSKDSIFYNLIRTYGPETAAILMLQVTKISLNFLMTYGFSIGIGDVTPSAELDGRKERIINAKYAEVEALIELYESGELPQDPGCTPLQTLEAKINGHLSTIREEVGSACIQSMHRTNTPLIMALCGSKGSNINLAQMAATVGQQTVSGQRTPDGFVDRSLPHFAVGSKHPAARGFVADSFYSGLTPSEFIFHAMAGREGLVDTAVKTAETGYMQRRLVKGLEDLHIEYDGTVRNSENVVVQFEFGGDSLDPMHMETSGPCNFPRLIDHIRGTVPNVGQPLLALTTLTDYSGHEVTETTAQAETSVAMLFDAVKVFATTLPPPADIRRYALLRAITLVRPAREVPTASRATINAFTEGSTRITPAKALDRLARRLFYPVDSTGVDEVVLKDMCVKVQPQDRPCLFGVLPFIHTAAPTLAVAPEDEAAEAAVRMGIAFTTAHVDAFLEQVFDKFRRAVIEPGTAVGPIGAQSIGEPGTQLTLRTFHFAGVASMNVTLGVPRIKEIINGVANLSTPIIKAKLDGAYRNKSSSARVVKGRIERTSLGDIADHIQEVYGPTDNASCRGCYVTIKLDHKIIQSLQLGVTEETVIKSILTERKMKIAKSDAGNIAKVYNAKTRSDSIRIFPAKIERDVMFYEIQRLMANLPSVIVSGIKTVERAVINDTGSGDEFELLVEGTGLRQVMNTVGVVGGHTTTNSTCEACDILGIEAARSTIINEFAYTMSSHGMAVDRRHIELLADAMTFKGLILGITRFGIGKMRDSVLMLASFERTGDVLFDAAAHTRRDPIQGVSESIVTGKTCYLGTGMMKLLKEPVGEPASTPEPRVTLLESTGEAREALMNRLLGNRRHRV